MVGLFADMKVGIFLLLKSAFPLPVARNASMGGDGMKMVFIISKAGETVILTGTVWWVHFKFLLKHFPLSQDFFGLYFSFLHVLLRILFSFLSHIEKQNPLINEMIVYLINLN